MQAWGKKSAAALAFDVEMIICSLARSRGLQVELVGLQAGNQVGTRKLERCSI
jgi:hypothetical protein